METTLLGKCRQAIARFSNDEEGANTLEIVMILAIAAIVAIAIYAFGGQIVDWAKKMLSTVLGWNADDFEKRT